MAELGARSFYAGVVNPLQPDPILNHVWVPNQVRTTTAFADRGVPPYTRQVNEQGWMMDREVTVQKLQGTYRIAYLGDSFIEGTCPPEDTVPSIVERSLKVPGFSKVEVINTGTSSYSPTLYYLLLKTKLLQFKPDLVVVTVDMTDAFDDRIYQATLTTDSDGNPVACAPGHPALATHRRTEKGLEELSESQRILAQGAQRSSLLRMVLDITAQIARKRGAKGSAGVPELFAWCDPSPTERGNKETNYTVGMVSRIISLAQSNGIKVVVTAVPHLEQLESRWSVEPMNALASLCAEKKVPFLNPVDVFKKRLGSTPPSAIYIPNDMHFNTRGYRMWGEIQLEFLNTLALP